MNEEIKEILDMFTKYKDDWYSCEYKLKPKQCVILYDYITNLQEENEFLKLNNPEMNIEHFRIVKENKRKIDNLRKENKHLKETNEEHRKINGDLRKENQKLVKELDTLRGRIITFINVFQDEKTFGLSYSDLKHLRGIANNNKFDIKVLDDKLTELKGGSDE